MFGNDNEPKILSESEIMEFKKKHGIVLFYMNGCGHCETMKPAWNKVITELKEKHKNEIILGAVESSSMEIFKKHGINPSVSGFPTILYFHPKKHNAPEYYKGDRSYEDLKKWILTKKGKGKSKSDTPAPILILTDANKNKNTNNHANNMGNKSKGYAFSQSGGGSTKKRRRIKRNSHKHRKTSVRRKSRRHRGHGRR
jgi:thiol-disulfide isomerase/thioredoxin